MAEKKGNGEKLASYSENDIFENKPEKHYVIKPVKLPEKELKAAERMAGFIVRRAPFGEFAKAFKNPALAKSFRDQVMKVIENRDLVNRLPKGEVLAVLRQELADIMTKARFSKPGVAADYVLDHSIGFGPIAPLIRDEELEEIMVNGFHRNVFVFHKKYGMCKTDIIPEKHDHFTNNFIQRIANYAHRSYNSQSPLLDARLPDGSRVNATFPSVTPYGPTITIRKFTRQPISIVHLIENQTLSAELASFLWLMVEGMAIEPKNIICTGGTSTGKTTALNALTSFVNHRDRMVTIEDTLELNLGGRENWVQMEAKPQTKETPKVTMDELLQNALRMRPDRIVVGEVRGEEAETLFVAMDTGHAGCLGTLHANTAREMLVRLKNPPMNVPEQMLPLLDLIIVLNRFYDPQKGLIRRVTQVAEISRMEEQVLLSNLFEWDKASDKVVRNDVPSHVMQTFSEKTGRTKKELKKELLVRQRILEWMLEKKLKSNADIEEIVQEYYFQPNNILEKIA
jgi:flagellar protein FlaI